MMARILDEIRERVEAAYGAACGQRSIDTAYQNGFAAASQGVLAIIDEYRETK